jgi:hypothetical protein
MSEFRLVVHGPPNCAQTQPSERLGSSLCGNGLHSLIDISFSSPLSIKHESRTMAVGALLRSFLAKAAAI